MKAHYFCRFFYELSLWSGAPCYLDSFEQFSASRSEPQISSRSRIGGEQVCETAVTDTRNRQRLQNGREVVAGFDSSSLNHKYSAVWPAYEVPRYCEPYRRASLYSDKTIIYDITCQINWVIACQFMCNINPN